MSYQYNNIPSIEDSNQEGNVSGDNSMAYPNNAQQPPPQGQPHQQQHQMHQHQQQRQMHQHQQQQPYGGARAYMPTYHEYMQSNVYGNGNGSSMSGFPSSFGSYGPNVGSTAWSRYIQDSKRNRIMVAVVIGIFLLLATSHSSPAPQSSPSSISSKNKKPTSTGGPAQKGIAGDGNQMHANNNTPIIPITPSTASSEEKEHESAATDSASNRNSDTMDDTGPTSDDSPELNLAYLLTYPMSGTSYTMFLATRSTNRTVATNYYSDAQQSQDELIPVNEKADGSPFWWGYSKTYFETEKPKPDDYVLTLTHCGGWCLHPCPHYEYIESASLFEESCRYVFQTPGPMLEEVDITPKRDVKKIVHLIRDPFSNIVSRYHQYRMHSSKKSHSDKGSKDDFRKWCYDIDYSNGEASPISSPSISLEIKEMMKIIPCHSEFFKYVAWHNHVVEMIWNEDYPTIQVYFEDYNNHGEDSSTEESADRKHSEEEEAMKIAKFLNISISETQARLPSFLKVIMYNSYFSEEEQKNVEMFVKTMAFRKTWTLLERYF